MIITTNAQFSEVNLTNVCKKLLSQKLYITNSINRFLVLIFQVKLCYDEIDFTNQFYGLSSIFISILRNNLNKTKKTADNLILDKSIS